MDRDERTQPQDLDTGERMGTYLGAAADGVAHQAKGEHETESGIHEAVGRAEAERIIENWPNPPKKVAQQMLEKYGPPNEATPTKLFWYRNGPWKRTELTSDVVAHNFPAPHTDFLTQVIDYRVPPEKIQLISQFDGSIVVDRTKGEVAARCDAEAANMLGMNMVHEIATGKRSVDEARETTAQNTVAYTMGRNAPYCERLLFEVPSGGTEDLDETMIAGAVVQQAGGKLKDVVTGGGEEPTDRRT
ncbi:MAG: hypothetical protein M3N31_00225 [Actinomycetota bacterium]|nr:hypothetical protein [Actinomycetota bacterium]